MPCPVVKIYSPFEGLPDFLRKKIDMENEIIGSVDVGTILPHISSNDIGEIVEKISPWMERFE